MCVQPQGPQDHLSGGALPAFDAVGRAGGAEPRSSLAWRKMPAWGRVSELWSQCGWHGLPSPLLRSLSVSAPADAGALSPSSQRCPGIKRLSVWGGEEVDQTAEEGTPRHGQQGAMLLQYHFFFKPRTVYDDLFL